MDPQDLFLFSQVPTTEPYPEPHESTPHPHALFVKDPVLVLSSNLCLSFLTGLFPSGFPTKILYTFVISLMCATCPAI